jgi:hypothetical protein
MLSMAVLFGVVLLALVGYITYLRNRLAVSLATIVSWDDYAWQWITAYQELEQENQSLERENQNLRFALAKVNGTAIKVSDNEYAMSLFDQAQYMATPQPVDLGSGRDAWNRIAKRRFVPMNGDSKNLVPVVKSDDSAESSWIEFERKPATVKPESKDQKPGKAGKDQSQKTVKAESSKRDQGDTEAVSKSEDNPESKVIARIMPVIEKTLKRKITAEELDWLMSKVPGYLVKSHPESKMVEFACNKFSSK